MTLTATAYRADYYESSVAIANYIIDSAPLSMIHYPGGTFNMGLVSGTSFTDELPAHPVTLNPFFISKYEVTQGEYQIIMGSNPASEYGFFPNYPVYNVSWYSAIKYCNLRSMAESLVPVYTIGGSTDPAAWGEVPDTGSEIWDQVLCNWIADGYRLPSEAEWECAARGWNNTPNYIYSGSNYLYNVGVYDTPAEQK